jgi:hypothetical protein
LFRLQFYGDRENRCKKTFQVLFQNNAELIEPAIDRTFTLTLQDIIMNQTNLNLVKVVEIYEGEIVDYRISPMTATADQQASKPFKD